MKLNFQKSDEGSVLLFGIGLGIVCLMVLTTAVNVATLWVTRSKLDSVADATALAASRSIDVEKIYQTGINQPIQLSNEIARIKATNYLNQMGNFADLSEFRLVGISVASNSVEVFVSANAQLPFGYLTYGLDSTVFSSAKVSIKTK